MKLSIFVVCICWLVPVDCLSADLEADANGFPAVETYSLSAEGDLQGVRDQLSRIFQFKLQAGILQIDREAWEREAEAIQKNDATASEANSLPPGMVPGTPGALRFQARQLEERARQLERQQRMGPLPPTLVLFQEVSKAARPESKSFGESGPGYSIHGRWKEWRTSFEGDKLSGQLFVQNEGEQFVVEERTPPKRTLEFVVNGNSDFRIELSNPIGEIIVWRQCSDGRVSIVTMLSGEVHKYAGKTFAVTLRQNRLSLERDVLPAFERCGIYPVALPNAQEVRKVVLSRLLRTEAAQAKGEKLLADLASDNDEIREKAQRWLNDLYDQYQDLIQERLQSESTAERERKCLQSIVDANPDSRKIAETIAVFDLANDPDYVATFLNDADPKDCPRIVQHLEAITGEHFGADAAAWKEWARQNH